MLKIPYGKTSLAFEEGGAAVLTSRIGELKAGGEGLAIVRAAMEKPIDSPRLSELARGKKNCVIIISDHTRPVPSRDILPNMFRELREGSPEIDITLLVATGFHRPSGEEELRAKLGDEIYEQSRIVIHDCRDREANVQIGVLPGVCDQVTVMGNHCSRFIDSEYARTGVLDGNPMHEDMLAAAKLAKLAYIVNVVIDEDKRTVAAFAGNPVTAHRAGCDFLLGYAKVSPVYADVVITSNGGAPLDQNLYQCVKSMTAAEASCNPGGVIIECAECADGHGGQAFYESLRDCESAQALYAQFMATPQEETIADQWESQILARILKKHTVIVVTRPALKTMVEEMKMRYAPSLQEALAMARAMGKESVTVIPNGISVIVREEKGG